MYKFLAGCAIGAVAVWLLLVHPNEVKHATAAGISTGAAAISSGATAAQKALK